MYLFRPITPTTAKQIVHWQYDPPYDIYNLDADAETILYLLEPKYAYHAIFAEDRVLAGFCSFGLDGQVAGGDYSHDALDVGAGMRPDLTGQGNGAIFIRAILDFGKRQFRPKAFRVTLAAFNQRVQRVCQRLGFVEIGRFYANPTAEFIIMLSTVQSDDGKEYESEKW